MKGKKKATKNEMTKEKYLYSVLQGDIGINDVPEELRCAVENLSYEVEDLAKEVVDEKKTIDEIPANMRVFVELIIDEGEEEEILEEEETEEEKTEEEIAEEEGTEEETEEEEVEVEEEETEEEEIEEEITEEEEEELPLEEFLEKKKREAEDKVRASKRSVRKQNDRKESNKRPAEEYRDYVTVQGQKYSDLRPMTPDAKLEKGMNPWTMESLGGHVWEELDRAAMNGAESLEAAREQAIEALGKVVAEKGFTGCPVKRMNTLFNYWAKGSNFSEKYRSNTVAPMRRKKKESIEEIIPEEKKLIKKNMKKK